MIHISSVSVYGNTILSNKIAPINNYGNFKIREEKILRIPLPDPISRIELMGLVKKELSFVFSNKSKQERVVS